MPPEFFTMLKLSSLSDGPMSEFLTWVEPRHAKTNGVAIILRVVSMIVKSAKLSLIESESGSRVS